MIKEIILNLSGKLSMNGFRSIPLWILLLLLIEMNLFKQSIAASVIIKRQSDFVFPDDPRSIPSINIDSRDPNDNNFVFDLPPMQQQQPQQQQSQQQQFQQSQFQQSQFQQSQFQQIRPSVMPKTTPSPQFLQCFANCPTTSEYNPICGNNQQLYLNEQKFNCARRCGADVQILRRGGCRGLFPITLG